MKSLENCRKEIDAIDQNMMTLFEQRMNIVHDVVQYKLAHHLDVFHPEREKEVIIKNVKRMEDEGLKLYAQAFITEIMSISKSYQMTFLPSKYSFQVQKQQKKVCVVGFQGVHGSFSSQALDLYFDHSVEKKNYDHFEDVFQALKNGDVDYGIVPLENSSTGAINDNYDLIRDYGFYIVGEQSVNVGQHLLGVQGSTIEDIRIVYSHPQGLLQSSHFLTKHPKIETRMYANTAMAAQYVASQGDKQIGAIASTQAAELYGLTVLSENVQNNIFNQTRFIVIAKQLEDIPNASCVSVVFTLAHEVGSLYQVMKVINDFQINMLRIESRPIQDKTWQYYFYVDFEGHLKQPHIVQALEAMRAYTNTLRVLGNYIKG